MATFDRSSGTPLGQILLQEAVITETSLSEALRVQARERQPLGELLVAGGAPEDRVWGGLAQQLGTTLTAIEHHWVDVALANELDATEAIRHRILPIRQASG